MGSCETYIKLGRERGKDSLVNSTRFSLQMDRVAQLRGHGMNKYWVVVDSIGGHGPLLLGLRPRSIGPGRGTGQDNAIARWATNTTVDG